MKSSHIESKSMIGVKVNLAFYLFFSLSLAHSRKELTKKRSADTSRGPIFGAHDGELYDCYFHILFGLSRFEKGALVRLRVLFISG